MLVHRALQVSKDHSRFDYGNPIAIDALDVIQLVSSEDDPAESDTPADRSRARTGNRNRNSIAVGAREYFGNVVDALRQNDTIRMTIADETRVR